MMRCRSLLVLPVLVGGLAATNPLQAGFVDFKGAGWKSTEALGSLTGRITYDSGLGSLLVELTNTSNPGNGGFITGFLFNIADGGNDVSVALTSATHPFLQTVTPMERAGAPFGIFDAGAALDGDWEGGGDPNPGIAVNQTGMFGFLVTGTGAGDLTATSFLDEGLVARFRGFVDGGSDKLPVVMVPLPAPILMAGVGLAGIILTRKKLRRSFG